MSHPPSFMIHWHDSLPSTQDEVQRRLARGEADFVVAARAQSAGRGRRGNDWHAPPGAGLLASFGLRLPATRNASDLTLVLALSLLDCIDPLLPPECRGALFVKWPNDLWLSGAKLAGILGEARTVNGSAAVALGAGVNLRQRAEDFPPGIDPAPVSLALAGCAAVPGPEAFLALLAPRFSLRLSEWRSDGLPATLRALADRWAFAPGDALSVEWGDAPCVARYLGVSDSGGLRVRLEHEGGRVVELQSGEARRLRPADAPPPR